MGGPLRAALSHCVGGRSTARGNLRSGDLTCNRVYENHRIDIACNLGMLLLGTPDRRQSLYLIRSRIPAWTLTVDG
jgi:hypothetical protein